MNLSVQVQNLSMSLGKILILKNISFEVHAGESVAVIGHNGAGKTSLFHVLMGFKFAQSGEAFLWNQKVENPESRKKMGYVPEQAYFSVEEDLQTALHFFGALHGMSAQQVSAQAAPLVKRFGLEAAWSKKFKHFSKGMLQKALLIQALLHDPELLILDEPMSGLDPESQEEMKLFLKEWKAAGKTLVFSSHSLEDVSSIADRVLKLSKGEVLS